LSTCTRGATLRNDASPGKMMRSCIRVEGSAAGLEVGLACGTYVDGVGDEVLVVEVEQSVLFLEVDETSWGESSSVHEWVLRQRPAGCGLD
jgi:hypothetical protein